MNNSVRVVIEVGLAIALVIAIIFYFNQSNTLTETQDALSSAESAGTTVAMNAAETSTQGAVNLSDAEATNTQGATNLDNANATATRSAQEANADQARLAATSTQSVLNFVADIDVLVGTATQSANTLADVSADATQSASDLADSQSIATQSASDIADANATIDAVTIELDNTVNQVATTTAQLTDAEVDLEVVQADLDDANAEIEDLTQQLEDAESDDDDSNGFGSQFTSGNFDLIEYENDDVVMSVTEDYIVLDVDDDVNDNIETITDLGSEYTIISQIFEQNAQSFVFFAVVDETDSDIAFEFITVISETFDMTIEEYIDANIGTFSDTVEVLEDDVIELDGEEVGYIRSELDLDIIVVESVQYIYLIDGDFYLITMFSTEDIFDDDQAALFEAMATTFDTSD